ncbi:MAG: zinc-ribbon domain-containing protein [Lachnospiraceae bacterium]|nr:zinc-ribbon domain-containing protein [Lachnospiraceae bacterium]
MFCNQCGTQIPENMRICPNCGADVGQAFVPVENTGMGDVPPVQNAGAGQIPIPQAQNPGTGRGYGQQGYGQPNQQMYGGAPMTGYSVPPQTNIGNVGAAFKNAPGEFAGRVKRMGISMFCLLGIIAAMLLLVAPFMNFASIHVNEKVEIPSYSSYMIGSIYTSKVSVKASVGLNLFELSQLSGTVARVADKLGGADTDDIADTLESAGDYLVRELEDEMDTNIKDGSVKEVFGTARLVLKGRAAVLVTP